jgi:sugar O-acyltransferase (sialic acid O-acetyltransferase NeuD family)
LKKFKIAQALNSLSIPRERGGVAVQKILLIGGGGHARVVMDALRLSHRYKVIGIVDRFPSHIPWRWDVPVFRGDRFLPGLVKKGIRHCFLAVGGGENPSSRVAIVDRLRNVGFSFVNVIHPMATISPLAKFGEGIFVAPGAVINAGSSIGDHSIINSNASVDHDCTIDPFSHVSPGVTLSGGVHVGAQTHLGTGCSVSHGMNIGARTIIGVGSAVISDIPGGVIAFGNPCRVAKKNPQGRVNA